MKLWQVNYGKEPSGRESTIILAETKDSAITLLRIDAEYYGHLVEKPSDALLETEREFRIHEIAIDEAEVIYTGSYCC